MGAATADNLLTMVRRLLLDSVWQVIAIGRANLELTGIGLALGGNARAGLEDALYLRKGEMSPGNLPLVQRAVNLAAALDRPAASGGGDRRPAPPVPPLDGRPRATSMSIGRSLCRTTHHSLSPRPLTAER